MNIVARSTLAIGVTFTAAFATVNVNAATATPTQASGSLAEADYQEGATYMYNSKRLTVLTTAVQQNFTGGGKLGGDGGMDSPELLNGLTSNGY